MARQDANETFAATSFLYGANAPYIEDLYARYSRDPRAVDEGWRAFFEGLKDDPQAVIAEAKGAPWRQANWPIVANGELVSALDGNWSAVEKALGESDLFKGPAASSGAFPPSLPPFSYAAAVSAPPPGPDRAAQIQVADRERLLARQILVDGFPFPGGAVDAPAVLAVQEVEARVGQGTVSRAGGR